MFFRWPWINWTYQHFWRLYHILSYCLPTNMDGAGAYYFMEIQGSTLDISDGTEKLRQVLAAKCSWSSGWWSTPRNSERRFFSPFFLLEMQFRFWKVNLGKPIGLFSTVQNFKTVQWNSLVSTCFNGSHPHFTFRSYNPRPGKHNLNCILAVSSRRQCSIETNSCSCIWDASTGPMWCIGLPMKN